VQVRFTTLARSQLLEAVVRLRDQDRQGAGQFVRRVSQAMRKLASDPEHGEETPTRRGLDYLQEGHRFFYRVRGDTLWILTVWEGEPSG
jgi:hypothetical protein